MYVFWGRRDAESFWNSHFETPFPPKMIKVITFLLILLLHKSPCFYKISWKPLSLSSQDFSSQPSHFENQFMGPFHSRMQQITILQQLDGKVPTLQQKLSKISIWWDTNWNIEMKLPFWWLSLDKWLKLINVN